jgi:hypothetical protein
MEFRMVLWVIAACVQKGLKEKWLTNAKKICYALAAPYIRFNSYIKNPLG